MPRFRFHVQLGFCMKSRCFCLIRHVIIVVVSSYRFPRFGHCRCCYRLSLPRVVAQLKKPFACESKSRFVAGPPPPPVTYPSVAACYYMPMSRMLGASMPYKRILLQRCLLQAGRSCYRPMSRNGRTRLLQTHTPGQDPAARGSYATPN